jgi:hypothetical protein
MTTRLGPIPLSDHRACLEQYLRGITFPPTSVAGRIIEERSAQCYACDPLRPGLVMWACAASGGEVADALPVAAAFDLFDRFLVLHDELSDESAESAARWGLGQSLNAGDALYALAFRTLASDVVNPDRRLRSARLVGNAVLEAIEGDDDRSRSAALTGAALRAGAVIAGASDDVARSFERAGRLLGTAPQEAVAALRDCTPQADLVLFEEVASYVAQRAG